MPPARENALDHMVLVLFENRSFDNLLGRLYAPGEVASFDGVVGKNFSNPVPDWAVHGAAGGVVPYGISVGMDAPDPDPGEEYPHTNTQLFNILDDANRFKDATEMVAPYNAPPAGRQPTMDGFVTDYISFLTVELGRQPTYEEYSQIMTGYTPEQVPVISTLARGFGVFDHWFSEVPSQTLPNRSFWTAATSSGFVVNRPVTNFMRHHTAETIFDRLERCGRTWKVYVLEPGPLSFTGFIHMPRLRDRFATHFVPFAEFERDAAEGTLPNFSLIEPNLMAGHGDYHPAFGRALIPGVDVLMDAPSSILAGEEFLGRIYRAVRSADSPTGSNAFNTVLFVGFDEPGGTYDHVPPGPVPPPHPGLPPVSSGSPSTVPVTASRHWSCRPGSPRAPCAPTSTATPPCWRRSARCGTSASPSPPGMRPRPASRRSSASRRRAHPRHGPMSTRCHALPSRRSRSRPCGRWARWAGTSATASMSTPAMRRTCPIRPTPTPRCRPRWPSSSPCTWGRGSSRSSLERDRCPSRCPRLSRCPCSEDTVQPADCATRCRFRGGTRGGDPRRTQTSSLRPPPRC